MMGPEGVTIVPMTPEMVPQAARLHRTALGNTRTALMGERYVRVFIGWFRQPQHGIAVVAIDGRRDVVGYVIGAPLGYIQALSRHLVWISTVSVITRPWLVFRKQFRSGVLGRLLVPLVRTVLQAAKPGLVPPTMSLVALAVSPDSREKRVGQNLMQACEERSRALRMRSLSLSTRSDNATARRLFQRCGWRLSSDSGEIAYYHRILEKDRA